MISFLRRFVPKLLRAVYHRVLADIANAYYRSPSQRLIVIGVTGTSGKSTVCYLLAKMLENAGFRVGLASTIMFKVDRREWLNDKKMTMVGRFQLQHLLSQMVKANCQYAIIETTSEGIAQFRHRHIAYDVLVCTNLYPEHIESHGSFEKYKDAKLTIFRELMTRPAKVLAGQTIKRVIVANLDDEHGNGFLNHPADAHYGFTAHENQNASAQTVRAKSIAATSDGVSFVVVDQPFHLGLMGEHSVTNALAAICVGTSQGLSLSAMSDGLQAVQAVPGRLEFIREGQPFTVIVDYAFEPRAMATLYSVVASLPDDRIIHVLGGTGGGRDRSRRAILGEFVGTHAGQVIVTNEDPYDEDPARIMEDVAAGVRKAGKRDGQGLLVIEDRRQAIAKALALAEPHDVVLITGKGSEQAIVGRNGSKTPWDDRSVVRELLTVKG